MAMFDSIILLTGAAEQPILGSILQGHDPAVTIRAVETPAELAAIALEWLPRARLIAFCTDVLVPPSVLQDLGYGAYNFHPGPPQFPGWQPARFAIHEGATEFGATAHVMVEKVDAGPIVGVEVFPVPHGLSVTRLEELSYLALAELFRRLAPALAMQAEPLAALPIRWSGQKCTRARYAALCAEAGAVGRVA